MEDLGKFFSDLAWSRIQEYSSRAPRSLQKTLGPSEIADPCERKIAFKISGTAETARVKSSGWEAVIGTAVHAYMEDVLSKDPAWVTEKRLDIAGVTQGTSDAFHLPTGTVVDWKVLGKKTLEDIKRANHPGDKYLGQGFTYALGWEQAGYDVKHVGFVILPRAQTINSRFGWTTPYDRQKALDVLDRYQRIVKEYKGNPQNAPRETSSCFYCKFWNPQLAATNPERACSGGREIRVSPVSMLD